MKLLIATQNKGKYKEIKKILQDLPLQLISPQDLVKTNPNLSILTDLDVPETGITFAENALLKAKPFAQKSNVMTIAEDSGLQVKILDNFPGVKSKRWLAGLDSKRNQALLMKMADKQDRSAEFVSVICLLQPESNEPRFFSGKIKGKLAKKSTGSAGFGYDPIFIPQGYKKTFAQLGLNVKNKLSHRRLALNKLKKYLQNS